MHNGVTILIYIASLNLYETHTQMSHIGAVSLLTVSMNLYFIIVIIIIIIIIKIGRQRKAWRERFIPNQCKDPSPTIPT